MKQRMLAEILEKEVRTFENKIECEIINNSKPMFLDLYLIIKAFNQESINIGSINPIKYAYNSNNLDCISNYRIIPMDNGHTFELFMVSSQLGFFCFLIENNKMYIYDMSDFKVETYSTNQKFVEIYHVFITDIIQDIIRSNNEINDILESIINYDEDVETPIRKNTTPSVYKPIMEVLFKEIKDSIFKCNRILIKDNFNLFEISNIRKITSIESIIYTMANELDESNEIEN